jgi:hypothetical protein
MCDMRCSKISAASVGQPSFQPHTWAKTNNWVYDFHSSSRELNILQILQLCSSTPLYSSYGKQAVSWLPCSHHGLKRPGTVRGMSSLGSQLVLLGWASKWKLNKLHVSIQSPHFATMLDCSSCSSCSRAQSKREMRSSSCICIRSRHPLRCQQIPLSCRRDIPNGIALQDITSLADISLS